MQSRKVVGKKLQPEEIPTINSNTKTNIFNQPQFELMYAVYEAFKDENDLIDLLELQSKMRLYGLDTRNIVFMRIINDIVARNKQTRVDYTGFVDLLTQHTGTCMTKAGREQIYEMAKSDLKNPSSFSHEEMKTIFKDLDRPITNRQATKIIFSASFKKELEKLSKQQFTSYIRMDE